MTLITSQRKSQSRATGARVIENTFHTLDGSELFYRAWLPAMPAGKALVLFHRGHEHSGRLKEFVAALGLEDVAVFAWDARGHGRSPGERGDAESFATFVRDADAFVRFVSKEYSIPVENIIALGHSVGAVIVAAWVHDYAPPVRAMVLATPALRVKLYVPFARQALRLRNRLGGRSFVKSYVKSRMLTHDVRQQQAYDADPLISRQIAVNILLGLHDTSTRLIRDAGAIRTPTLVLASGSDWVVENTAIERFFERLGAPVKQLQVFDGFSHAILHETRRDLPIGRIRDFVRGAFDRPVDSTADSIEADAESVETFERISRPLPAWCPKRWSFAVQRAFLRTVGRMSHGVALGWRAGFSSGASLDHVYENRARGHTPLGRLIDLAYLNSVGWRGIRRRKAHLKQLVNRAVAVLLDARQPVRIVDVAAGPGRYLLEVLSEHRGANVAAVLRDRNEAALDQGRRHAASLGLTNVHFEPGDAFDGESLANLRPRPNVAVVSGLYELFEDNDKVLRSLRGIAAAVPRGGYLVYTNQPYHPQLEMIARVLVHGGGSPWVMRCRPQREMDALARAAGFEKLDMLIDDDGIFTVSLARRV